MKLNQDAGVLRLLVQLEFECDVYYHITTLGSNQDKAGQRISEGEEDLLKSIMAIYTILCCRFEIIWKYNDNLGSFVQLRLYRDSSAVILFYDFK